MTLLILSETFSRFVRRLSPGVRYAAPALALALTGFVAFFSIGAQGAELPAASAALLPRTASVEASVLEVSRAEEANARAWHKRWVISLVPLAASQSLDAASSYGLRELNPVLASSNGGFGMKAVGIKAGSVGGLMVAEYLLVKKYPRSAKFFSLINFTTAGVTTGFAVHNFSLR